MRTDNQEFRILTKYRNCCLVS